MKEELQKRKACKPLNIIVDSVEEKWGTLRFYYHFEGENPGIQAFDFPGSVSVRTIPQGDDIREKISKIVSRYEGRSGEVCDACGRKGKLREYLGWISVLCDACYLECTKMERSSYSLADFMEEK